MTAAVDASGRDDSNRHRGGVRGGAVGVNSAIIMRDRCLRRVVRISMAAGPPLCVTRRRSRREAKGGGRGCHKSRRNALAAIGMIGKPMLSIRSGGGSASPRLIAGTIAAERLLPHWPLWLRRGPSERQKSRQRHERGAALRRTLLSLLSIIGAHATVGRGRGGSGRDAARCPRRLPYPRAHSPSSPFLSEGYKRNKCYRSSAHVRRRR